MHGVFVLTLKEIIFFKIRKLQTRKQLSQCNSLWMIKSTNNFINNFVEYFFSCSYLYIFLLQLTQVKTFTTTRNNYWVVDIKLIVCFQWSFTLSTTYLAELSLLLGAWGTLKKECWGDQAFFVTAKLKSSFVHASPSHKMISYQIWFDG